MDEILVVDADPAALTQHADELLADGHDVNVAETSAGARAKLPAARTLILGQLSSTAESLTLLRALRSGEIPHADPTMPVITIGAERDHELQRLREHSAHDEVNRIQWPWHVGNLVTALIPGAILWFGFDRQLDGILASVGGFALGEVELLTQPTRLTIDHSPPVSGGARAFLSSRGGLVTYVLVW